MQFRFIVRQEEIFNYTHKSFKENIETFICTVDERGIVLPHPISSFIKVNFSALSLNTQKRYAEEIKKFLNYILDNIDVNNKLYSNLKTEGLKKLTLEHGADYLRFLSNKVSLGYLKANTFYFSDRVLILFYKWLNDQSLLEQTITIPEVNTIHKGTMKSVVDSPFNRLDFGVPYPKRERDSIIRKRKLHDFGYGRVDLINMFLRIAELVEPDIAFGIALQFYGGLRKGEVINLKINSVREEQYSSFIPLLVDIKDNWREIFKNKTVTNSEQVKFEREQIIFRVNIVDKLYKHHKEHLKAINNSKGNFNPALFKSSRTGKPICGQAYYRKFNNVKNKFLELVLESDIDDYNRLISKPWATHIGRGIFTNILVFELGWEPSEIALARGDASINSSATYVEENNLIKLTNQAILKLERMALARKQEGE